MASEGWRHRGFFQCVEIGLPTDLNSRFMEVAAVNRPTDELYNECQPVDHGVEVDLEPYHYDSVVAAFHRRKHVKGVGVDPLAVEAPWESKLLNQPVDGGLPTVTRLADVILHYCPSSKKSFLARPLIWKDPVTNRRYFFCPICDKAGLGKRASWHYMSNEGLKPKGYVQQAVRTAVGAVSASRRRIGLNPPTLSDVQAFMSGWWPFKPFVGGTGNFNTKDLQLSPAAIRDVLLLLEAKGQIVILDDPITSPPTRRVLGGLEVHNVACYVSGRNRTYSLMTSEDAPKLYHLKNYDWEESWKPPLRHLETIIPRPPKEEPWRCLRARIIEKKKELYPNDPEKWDICP